MNNHILLLYVGFGGGSRRAFRDPSLFLPDLNGPRALYMVLFDKELPDVVLSCGKFRELRPRKARAFFAQKGVRGEIILEQRSPIDPTHVLVNVTGKDFEMGLRIKIRLKFIWLLSRIKRFSWRFSHPRIPSPYCSSSG